MQKKKKVTPAPMMSDPLPGENANRRVKMTRMGTQLFIIHDPSKAVSWCSRHERRRASPLMRSLCSAGLAAGGNFSCGTDNSALTSPATNPQNELRNYTSFKLTCTANTRTLNMDIVGQTDPQNLRGLNVEKNVLLIFNLLIYCFVFLNSPFKLQVKPFAN